MLCDMAHLSNRHHWDIIGSFAIHLQGTVQKNSAVPFGCAYGVHPKAWAQNGSHDTMYKELGFDGISVTSLMSA